MKIFNDNYEVSFTTLGGEMSSFLNKQAGVQYLWQGDDKYWSGKNPTLFPIVGNTFDGTYQVDGQTYSMKNHGLIRYADLECIKKSDSSITFELKSNIETLKQYPFQFNYQITYTLIDNKIEIAYSIINKDKKTMPFTFGLHPGFNCPILEGEKFEDYVLEFEKKETLEQLIFDVKREKPHYFEKVELTSIPMDYKIMESYLTLIYKGMNSSYVSLKGPKHSVRVSISGYPLLAIWTPTEGAPFVCIEPWFSHADFEKNDVAFEKREGMLSIEPEQEFNTSYTIEVF